MLLTADEAAKILRVRPRRVHQILRDGLLKGSVRIGRQVRIRDEALDDFIRNGGKALQGGWRRQ